MRTIIYLILIYVIAMPFNLFAQETNPFKCKPISELFAEIDKLCETAKLFGTGPEVLGKAKELEENSMSLLGRYIKNGERGFPQNEDIGFCLQYWSYESGNALSAFDIAKKYVEIGEFSEAVKYYGVVFGYSYAYEAFKVKEGILRPLKPQVNLSHIIFAEAHSLIESNKISRDLASQMFEIGCKKGVALYRPPPHIK